MFERLRRWREPSGATWPDALLDQHSVPLGIACLELLSDTNRWVHRRVETIDLLRPETVRRQVTIDFTLPSHMKRDLRLAPEGPWIAPLGTLRKAHLRNFDLLEQGVAVPLLTSRENAVVAREVLMAAAAVADPRVLVPSDAFEAALTTVVNSDGTDDVDPIAKVREVAVADECARAALRDARFLFFLLTFADSYPLLSLK